MINSEAGSVVVDTSSSSPFDTRRLGRELAELSVLLVDSPITQKELHAIDRGGATLMVGSDSAAALDKVMPVLRDMSTHVFPMGGLGSGHTMKTLNNYVSVGSIIALCDALVKGPETIDNFLPLLPESASGLEAPNEKDTGHWSEIRSGPADDDQRLKCRDGCQLLYGILDEVSEIV